MVIGTFLGFEGINTKTKPERNVQALFLEAINRLLRLENRLFNALLESLFAFRGFLYFLRHGEPPCLAMLSPL
jgi:hypothetical protein